MTRLPLAAALLGATLAASALPAAAVNCYEILDRNEAVIYRGTMPPVDLSDKGKPERDALRARGEYLIAMDVDRCFAVEYFTGAAGSRQLSVDEIVNGIPTSRAARTAASPGVPAGAAKATSAPSAPAPRAGMSGSGTRSSY